MQEDEILALPDAVHIVGVSGGKDSTGTYCLAIELLGARGFRAWAADTDNEDPRNYEQIGRIPEWTGGPRVEWFKADFTERLVKRRAYILEHWPKPRRGRPAVPQEMINRAVAVLDDRLAHPEDANAFLDMCLVKGRFPSRKAQFCTEELKVKVLQAAQAELLRAGRTVVSWQGIRADESYERSLMPPVQELNADTICGGPVAGRLFAFRPLLNKSADEVFAIAARHGVPRNPLYDLGASRVGCWPCVNCGKLEILLVARHSPQKIARIAEMERIVSQASRLGVSTFFHAPGDPVMADELAYHEALGAPLAITPQTHGINRMVEWAKTARGGRQYQLFDPTPVSETCASAGTCE